MVADPSIDVTDQKNGQGARVFFVDDDPLVSEMIREVIPLIGHQLVGHAINGLEAVQMYPALMPDITIMDCRMPVMDGIRASAEIKAYDPKAKIIMLSGHFVDKKAAESAGVMKIIQKPVSIQELKQEIESALRMV